MLIKCGWFDVVGKDQQKKKISVAEYFKTNVGIALKFARLPLIIERCESGENYYPMELLVVCENQRVKQTQQSSEQIQAMISACAALPSDRKRQTSIMTQALKLDGATKNRWFDEYNVKITKNLALEGRVLPSPQIEYGRNVKTPVNPERVSPNNNSLGFVCLIPVECSNLET
ncbi:unnamed protein product [Anisakis simplex]|uniref:PAZ domain-containing protein n=1 Tax=Anisakis simplex TaxID=6269 RepID=A0A0M3J6R5_ANISI|nr:unnamed protein product [Anisakis simplex]